MRRQHGTRDSPPDWDGSLGTAATLGRAGPSLTVVIPAFNAAPTIGQVLESLAKQDPAPDEVIVVDDGSTDETAAIAAEFGARVVTTRHKGFAGGARNRGWSEATSDTVVFLDADAVPSPDWAAAMRRALAEHPGAVIGGARTFTARTAWGWVAHLQVESPYLPRGDPRRVSFISSYCMAVPRTLDLRFDESYGGEDAVFSADVHGRGMPQVFDPRIVAAHRHLRESYADLRRQQKRLAYGLARCGIVQREGLHRGSSRACRCTTSFSRGFRSSTADYGRFPSFAVVSSAIFRS